MDSMVTEGIKIIVEQFYQPDYSNPLQLEFMFAYRITIENNNPFPVQLLRRHWYIVDSNADQKEVDGEGVIGEKPIIKPGDSHEYSSGCLIKSTVGAMRGFYNMIDINTGKKFRAYIPTFKLNSPQALN